MNQFSLTLITNHHSFQTQDSTTNKHIISFLNTNSHRFHLQMAWKKRNQNSLENQTKCKHNDEKRSNNYTYNITFTTNTKWNIHNLHHKSKKLTTLNSSLINIIETIQTIIFIFTKSKYNINEFKEQVNLFIGKEERFLKKKPLKSEAPKMKSYTWLDINEWIGCGVFAVFKVWGFCKRLVRTRREKKSTATAFAFALRGT